MMSAARGESAIWETRLLGVVSGTLAVIGVAAVYGASSITAVQMGLSGSAFALRQLVGALIGLVLLLLVARIDYHVWQRLAWPLIVTTVALLLVPLVPGLRSVAPELNGSRRWINLGIMTIQPSELAKFGVVVWTAMLATRKGEAIRELKHGLLPFLVILAPIGGVVLFRPAPSHFLLGMAVCRNGVFPARGRVWGLLVVGLIAG